MDRQIIEAIAKLELEAKKMRARDKKLELGIAYGMKRSEMKGTGAKILTAKILRAEPNEVK
jgi:hypothetical protein